jgi:hypothetical protein
MKYLEKNKSVVIAAILLVMVIFGYRTFFKTEESPVDVLLLESNGQNQEAGRQIVDLVSVIKSVTLSQDLFASPLYKSLNDFSVDLPSQSTGRSNPFAPIGN